MTRRSNMTKPDWTPGPWEYVPSTEHHGPYVCGPYGPTIADCYAMSDPNAMSVRNGGTSYPIHFMAEMADPNARLIAAAPDLYEALSTLVLALPEDGEWGHFLDIKDTARAALAKAEGRL